MMRIRRGLLFAAAAFWLLFQGPRAVDATTVADALRLTPVQPDVDYDKPAAEQINQCKLEAVENGTAWVVLSPSGQTLRRFADTNGDKNVDQWCYFASGIEVYRDIDADFNEKADQYRWLGTAGMRWGIDQNEDGQIDMWRAISAEEVTSELVAAVRENDYARFQRLLISSEEIGSLGLSREKQAELREKAESALNRFRQVALRQKLIGRDTKWVHFGGTRPGVLPAGTDGSTRDLVIYENVLAMIERTGVTDNSRHGQLNVGSLVRVGDSWRLIDLPSGLLDDKANAAPDGFFLTASRVAASGPDVSLPEEAASERTRKLTSELDEIEKRISRGTVSAREMNQLHDQQVRVLQELANQAGSDEERRVWIRQLADTVSGAVQTNAYANGARVLQSLATSVAADRELAAYVKFRDMSTDYTVQLQNPNADIAKVQEEWLARLEAFVKEYPASDDAPEAMLQLAVAEEFAGNDAKANGWYRQITAADADELLKRKAQGAILRLNSVGKPIRLTGPVVNAGSRPLDLAALRGKIVVVHFWATWCEPCKEDIKALRELRSRYGGRGFECVGINLDNEADAVKAFVRQNQVNWPQIHETGGLDSRLAVDFGVVTLPTMLLIDDKGHVLNRNVHVTELEQELRKRLK
jgi:thiol-disulfide isomerase/thioredoxin